MVHCINSYLFQKMNQNTNDHVLLFQSDQEVSWLPFQHFQDHLLYQNHQNLKKKILRENITLKKLVNFWTFEFLKILSTFWVPYLLHKLELLQSSMKPFWALPWLGISQKISNTKNRFFFRSCSLVSLVDPSVQLITLQQGINFYAEQSLEHSVEITKYYHHIILLKISWNQRFHHQWILL